jgi:opacity protein-like surface antigen
MKILACACILLLAAMTLSAADITGKWSGSFTGTNAEGESHQSTAFVVFKQSGTEITGTAGPDENQQFPITRGKIDGNKITFEVQSDGPLYKLDLTLAGDHIKGEATVEQEGHVATGKVDMTRVK